MKPLSLKVSILMALAIAIGTSPAFAGAKGYGFVYAYSYALKEAYRSPIFTHPVEGKSLNDKEYISDIKLIRHIEDTFGQYLKSQLHVDPSLFDVSARTGYKTKEIAQGRMEDEIADLKNEGIEMKLLPGFTFKTE